MYMLYYQFVISVWFYFCSTFIIVVCSSFILYQKEHTKYLILSHETLF